MSSDMRWGDLVVTGDARRRALRDRHGNGLDGVEVREGGRRLLVYFFEHAPRGLHPGNVRIEAPHGGRPVRAIEIRRAEEPSPDIEDRLIVELDHAGTAGPYLLRIVERRPDGTPGSRPHRGIDPRYAQVRFVFDVDEPHPPIQRLRAGASTADDTVSYIHRDYAGLRQLMLDRLAVTMPDWTEQHEPDIWITLVELLAYIGDDLSYYQDAVATEAYLRTARNRISVRRHARLVGYRLHEGCTARGWVCIKVTAPVSLPLNDVRFAAAGGWVDGGAPVLEANTLPAGVLVSLQQYSPVSVQPGAQGLQPVVELLPAHNTIELWSWGEDDSHLAAGATSAVLVDGPDRRTAPDGTDVQPQRALQLKPGDVLILEQTKDPLTGGVGLADPTLRQAVRLTGTQRLTDALFDQPLLEVQWSAEDALGFDLPVTAGGNQCSQASGNVVLVANGVAEADTVDLSAPALSRRGLSYATRFPDPNAVGRHQARRLRSLYHKWRAQIAQWRTRAEHGTTLTAEQLAVLDRQIGEQELERLGLGGGRRGVRKAARADLDADALTELLARADRLLAGRRRRLDYLARLAAGTGPLNDVLIAELTQDWGQDLTEALAAGEPGSWGPAATAITQDPRAALPLLQLADRTGKTWSPALDLIDAAPTDRVFVAEVNDQGIAQLRINNPPAVPISLPTHADTPSGSTLPFVSSAGVIEGMLVSGVNIADGTTVSAVTAAEVTLSRAVIGAVPRGSSITFTPTVSASYWVGNGTSGNAETEAINALVWAPRTQPGGVEPSAPGGISGIRNPLAVAGGTDAETVAAAKLAIPGSYAVEQQRALTADDYAALAAAMPGVRRGAAEMRFTGSSAVVDVAIQPTLGEDPPEELLAEVHRSLQAVRRIGQQVRVLPPRYRPLVVELDVALSSGAIRRDVAHHLARLLSSGWLHNGRPALFNPANLGFALPVYSSPIIAAVQAVAGIDSLTLTRFGFLDQPAASGTAAAPPSQLQLGALQIARLDNDPTRPEHGYALISLEGGR